MLIEMTFENGKCVTDSFRFVRHNDDYESIFRRPADEGETLADLAARSKALGATLIADGDRVLVTA
jgi:hypothetical protein